MHRGYIKVWRKVLESSMYKNLTLVQRDVFWTILSLANHKDNEWEWKGEVFKVQPGQLITSLPSLKSHCAKGVSIQNIRTALEKLAKWHFLTSKSTVRGRLITLINWGTYQQDNITLTDKPTDSQQTTNRQLTANKNDKNDKNDKNKNKDSLSATPKKLFQHPALSEVQAYCQEKNYKVNVNTFHSHYESNGWRVGKNKMKDWKAALRGWESRDGGNGKGAAKPKSFSAINQDENIEAARLFLGRER